MKKICWITPDYFLIVDAPKVPHLTSDFEIDWHLISTFNTDRKPDGLLTGAFKPKETRLKYRQRDPRIIWQYLSFLLCIRKSKPDIVYISFHGFPYFFPLLFLFFRPEKIIWGVHNIVNPKGSFRDKWMDIYQSFIFSRIKRVHVFSRYQLSVVRQMFPAVRHYCIPLTLEDYGVSKITPPDDTIRFLFFGYIEKYKGLDLLIRSFAELQADRPDIELVIAGKCDDWGPYSALIGGNRKITVRRGPIPNADLPDLISSCHYVVLPYLDGTQSGVLRLAYQYNRPVIVSDIESFRQSVTEGISGYFFKSGSQVSLTETMKRVAENHKSFYNDLGLSLRSYVKSEYDIGKVISEYRNLLAESVGLSTLNS